MFNLRNKKEVSLKTTQEKEHGKTPENKGLQGTGEGDWLTWKLKG